MVVRVSFCAHYYFHIHDFFCALVIAVLLLLTATFILAPNFFSLQALIFIYKKIYTTSALKVFLGHLTVKIYQIEAAIHILNITVVKWSLVASISLVLLQSVFNSWLNKS